MKNLFIAVIIGFFFIAACNSSSDPKATETDSAVQKNLEAAHNISKAFETGNIGLIDNSVAHDIVDHRDEGDVKGIDTLKALVKTIHDHVKDMKMEVVKELADRDYVMQWIRFSGRGDGQASTINGDFNVKGIEITRFKDGKAVEHWEAMDVQDVARMMQEAAKPNEQLEDSTQLNK